MARFKRSEYDSVLKENSPYRDMKSLNDDDPTPLFMYDDKHLVMWSGEGDVPEVGDKVDMRVPVRYTGIVQSHFMEYGYVGMRVLPYPEYHEALSQQGYGKLPKVGEKWTREDVVYNYGVDIYNDN
jgi:hypothetical protein